MTSKPDFTSPRMWMGDATAAVARNSGSIRAKTRFGTLLIDKTEWLKLPIATIEPPVFDYPLDESKDALSDSISVVTRCREEGKNAATGNKDAVDCPYSVSDELERAGWLDGWSRERRDITERLTTEHRTLSGYVDGV